MFLFMLLFLCILLFVSLPGYLFVWVLCSLLRGIFCLVGCLSLFFFVCVCVVVACLFCFPASLRDFLFLCLLLFALVLNIYPKFK